VQSALFSRLFSLKTAGTLSAKTFPAMPRGSKSSYSGKQKRQAEHIAQGYKKRGTRSGEAKRRAWATVNKMTGGGKRSGSGRGKKTNLSPARKGGRIGGGARSRR
jgi:hypothetical protein